MQPRFHDYPLEMGPRLAYTARAIGIGTAVGGGLGFLLALAASITVNEAFIDVWTEFDGDPFSRALIPLLSVTLVIGLAIYAIGDSAYNWQLGCQLARAAPVTPDRVPPEWQRAFVTREKPFTVLVVVLWCVAVAGALFALILIAIVGETSDDELPFVLGMLLGALAIAAVCVGGAVLAMRVSATRWPALMRHARDTWSPTAMVAVARAEKARRPQRRGQIDVGGAHRLLTILARRGFRVALAVTLAGSAIGFLGVAIRQPCRQCEPRSYGSLGEGLIDNLALVGASVAAIGFLIFIAVAIASAVATAIATRALRVHLDPMASAGVFPSVELMHDRLVELSLAEKLAIVAAALGAASVTTGVSLAAVGLSPSGAVFGALLWGGIAALVLAGILTFAGVGAKIRMRAAIRDHWAPGDVPIPPATRGRTRTRSRDR